MSLVTSFLPSNYSILLSPTPSPPGYSNSCRSRTSARCREQGARCRVQAEGCRVQGKGCKVQNLLQSLPPSAYVSSRPMGHAKVFFWLLQDFGNGLMEDHISPLPPPSWLLAPLITKNNLGGYIDLVNFQQTIWRLSKLTKFKSKIELLSCSLLDGIPSW